MRRFVSVLEAPAVEVVDLPQLRDFLRLDTDADDAMLARMATAAREQVEAYTGRSLVQRTLVLTLDEFPGGRVHWLDRAGTRALLNDAVELPGAPLVSVTSIEYEDLAGVTQTLDAGAYEVQVQALPPRVLPAVGYAWPAARAVTITYEAGYGTEPTLVPAALREAVMRIAAMMYERECTDCTSDPQVRALLDAWRVWRGRMV